MKLGMQQPYLFPYIGYFQLIRAVDQFVLYDDVQYIKGGWINRNRILIQGRPFMFTFGLKNGARAANINERYFSAKHREEKASLLKTLRYAYKKAPYFGDVFNLVGDILANDELNLAKMLAYSLKKTCEYLEIKTPIIMVSNIEKDLSLKREKRMFDIFTRLGVDHYLNSIGGQKLYSKAAFLERKIKLEFLQTRPFEYQQFDKDFIPNLSIIDVMMFNSRTQIAQLLELYDLV
jgi:hypothetical protein